jgi:5-methyltetrahydropteroyltriglutamate--homocysteine methyltransferase
MADLPLFPCTIVGSLPQPEWLIDRQRLAGQFPPRTRALELWRVAPELLLEAQRDAVRLAVAAEEAVGLDIVGDGEIGRESYSNHFANALDGIDLDNPGKALDRSGEEVFVPRITGPIRRRHAVGVDDVKFLRSLTDRPIKFTVPGPFTMSQQAQDDHYGSRAAAAMDYAAAVNEEVKDLLAAGADVVQLDEPYMQARPEQAREYGLEALNRALEGVDGKTCVHICFGYAALIHARPEGYSYLPELAAACCDQISIETAQSHLDCRVLESLPDKQILLGVIDLSTPEVESVATIVERVKRALPHIDASRVILAPDCGMKYLPRESAYGKLANMVAAARQLRAEFG